jgi:hypothetical protein
LLVAEQVLIAIEGDLVAVESATDHLPAANITKLSTIVAFITHMVL